MTEYYKQPFNNTVPDLVKVNNWEDDETKNEILTNVQEIAATVAAIEGNTEQSIADTAEIRSFTKQLWGELKKTNSGIGVNSSTIENNDTVISLLKSIVNKLS